MADCKPEHLLKVTVTRTGDLAADIGFWHVGGEKPVIIVDRTFEKVRAELGCPADIVGIGPDLDWGPVLDELGA